MPTSIRSPNSHGCRHSPLEDGLQRKFGGHVHQRVRQSFARIQGRFGSGQSAQSVRLLPVEAGDRVAASTRGRRSSICRRKARPRRRAFSFSQSFLKTEIMALTLHQHNSHSQIESQAWAARIRRARIAKLTGARREKRSRQAIRNWSILTM
jgi:hypothetical protein